MKRTFILTACLLTVAAGCADNGNRPAQLQEIHALREEKRELTRQIEQAKAQNEQLEKRVHVLSGLPDEVKGQNLYRLQSIKITGYTNFYDKDKDGKKEKLIVYIQPIDGQGDIIKAAGEVDVQLWNLNNAENEALLGEWHVDSDELKELWFATLVTINYRLTFDVTDKVSESKVPLTVKVTFTDYLSGKVFDEQKVIKPD